MDYVRYIDKTTEYYRREGYAKPYQWACFDEVAFTPLNKPLAESRVTIVSTSDIAVRAGDDDPAEEMFVGEPYVIPADTPLDNLFSRQEHFDKYATHLEDVDSYFPISRLREAAAAGRIGSIAARLHGVHTSYSQRRTSEFDAPMVLDRCREDGVDVAVMTPVCPVCHQTISLVARHLEENGIPTVLIANARDIVETCGVARLVFVDFPLGNPCGEPGNLAQQREIFDAALDLLETATGPRTTREMDYRWPGGEAWKRLIFSDEQPFLEGEARDHWLAAKARYKELKAEGKV